MERNATGWVIVLAAIGSLMAALDTLVVATALSTIRVDLGASIDQLEWTVNACYAAEQGPKGPAAANVQTL